MKSTAIFYDPDFPYTRSRPALELLDEWNADCHCLRGYEAL